MFFNVIDIPSTFLRDIFWRPEKKIDITTIFNKEFMRNNFVIINEKNCKKNILKIIFFIKKSA